MVICPKCKEEINFLLNFQSGEMRYDFDGEHYEDETFIPDCSVNEYECPDCRETLFTDENKAREFLELRK